MVSLKRLVYLLMAIGTMEHRSVHISSKKPIQLILIGPMVGNMSLLFILKRREFDDKAVIMLSKLIPQNMIVILQYNNECKIAVYHIKLFQTDWMEKDKLKLDIRGIDLYKAWENIVSDIGNFELTIGKDLREQIAINDKINKLKKEIERLEKQARSEKQPKKKYEFVLEERKLKKELKTLLESI